MISTITLKTNKVRDIVRDCTSYFCPFLIAIFFCIIVPHVHEMFVLHHNTMSDMVARDIRRLSCRIMMYKAETGTYPETLEDLIKTKEQYVLWIEKLLEAPYADQGIHYRYEYDREKDRYVLFSAGYDGKADSNISDGILGDDIGCIDGKDIGYMEKNGWWIYR